ncbi:MAG TPA: hypothetical protein VEA39_06120 [Methylophilaceae bacterium]|nr:hypothetical protein [Methylophilaceae bacterium]
MDKNTGGSAFPYGVDGVGLVHGMTLRDYFAAKAPVCPASFSPMCLRNRNPDEDGKYGSRMETEMERLSRWAYEYADAMLKAREA